MIVKTKQEFMCESCPKKQAFLKMTNPLGGMLIGNARFLVSAMARNLFDGVRSPIPYTFLLIAGFVCADKSPVNNNSKTMKGSIQRGVGETS
jgi:hypothetical protein